MLYCLSGLTRLCGGKPLGGLFSLRASRRGPLVLSAGVSFVIVVVFGYGLVYFVVAGGAGY